MRKTSKILCGALATFLVMSTPSLAQKTGPNGGLIAGKDGHETELVVSPTEITVYLIDDGKQQKTKGATVRAVIQQAGKSITVNLTDADGTKLVGKLAAPLGAGAIVVITGKDDHGHNVSSRYVIK